MPVHTEPRVCVDCKYSCIRSTTNGKNIYGKEIGMEQGETALHLAVRSVDRTSLHIVDFLVQNSGNLDKQTAKGSTALHYCCLTDNTECLKLLLRGKASIEIANEAGETPLDIARRLKHIQCEDLLMQALSGRFNSHVHVEYEWRLHHNQDLDESDDDAADEKLQQPSPNRREDRPVSFYQISSNQIHTNVASLARDAANIANDKQRSFVPSILQNETYGALLSGNNPPTQAIVPVSTSGPPLPPRNFGKVQPSVIGSGVQTTASTNSTWKSSTIGMETIGRQRSSSDPPAIKPPVPPLRVTSTATNPPFSVPSPPVPKTTPATETNQPTKPKPPALPLNKPVPPPLPPQPPSRISQKKPIPGTEKPSAAVNKEQPRGLTSSYEPGDSSDTKSCTAIQPPAPMPRKSQMSKAKPKRVKAIYNCLADNPDELTFSEGEFIIVDGEEDLDWWIGHIDGEPNRRGAFPVSFVHFVAE